MDDSSQWEKVLLTIVHEIIVIIAIVFWIIGVAVANGGWMIALAIFFPPASWVFAAKYFLGV